MSKRISIIIPAFNEADTIYAAITSLRSKSTPASIADMIVVDGGSSDQTEAEAKRAGAAVIQSNPGRAVQMNAGARAASGEILYFLHADSAPPDRFDQDILSAIDNGVCAGSYLLKFDYDHWVLRLICALVNRIPRRSLGDRSLFVDRAIFEQIGGYNESLTIMEDADIVKRIGAVSTFKPFKRPITTSGRKFRENGELRLFLIFALIYVLYEFGVSHDRLLSLYRRLIRQDKI